VLILFVWLLPGTPAGSWAPSDRRFWGRSMKRTQAPDVGAYALYRNIDLWALVGPPPAYLSNFSQT